MQKTKCAFWAIALLLMPFTGVFAGQPVLIRADRDVIPQDVQIKTFVAESTAALTPVVPSKELTIAVLPDTLLPESFDETRQKLTALFGAWKERRLLTLALITANGVERKGPFSSRSQFQAALRSLEALGPETETTDTGPGNETEPYTLLGGWEPPAAAPWSCLLVIGRFPTLEPNLKEYTAAYLSNRFRAARVRVSQWAPGETGSSIFDLIADETGGIASPNSPADLLLPEGELTSYVELTWPEPSLKAGFHLYQAQVVGNVLGEKYSSFSSFATAPGFVLPSISGFRGLRERTSILLEARQRGALKPEELSQVRTTLNESLKINPEDHEVLATAADIFEQSGSLEESAVYLDLLSEIQPHNGELFARLGNLHFRTKNRPPAEKALMRARELHSRQFHVSKQLGQIAAARQDDGSALSLFDESLTLNPDDAETWFLRAESASRIKDWVRQADSLEHGLAIQPGQLVPRTDLVRLYIEHGENEKAVKYIQPVLEDPPPDVSVRGMYASLLEQTGQNDAALVLWKKTLELDSRVEPAHYGVAHLLFDGGDFAGCVRAASDGLVHVPSSARLYLVKSSAQENLSLWYDARKTLQEGSLAADDLNLLKRNAETEDQYGRNAGQAYQRAVLACEKGGKDPQGCSGLMDRGLLVSIRDNTPELAEWFATRLRSVGLEANASLLKQKKEGNAEVQVPGGLAAILLVLGGSQEISKEDFLKEFSRIFLSLTGDGRETAVLRERVSNHFGLIKDLKGLGTLAGDSLKLVLSVSDRASRERTKRALKLLGWEMKDSGEIEPAQGTTASARQITSAALAFDEIEMQEALKARKSFAIDIIDDWVPAVLGEATWRDQFFGRRGFPGGFTQALAEDPNLAKLYVGISEMDDSTSEELVKDFSLKTLHDKWVDHLYSYSVDFVVRDGRALVPGGREAESIWQKMTGANPAIPRQFFRELLRKDDGKLLAFFSRIMQLDMPHQRFFSSSLARTARFYDLFKDSPEIDIQNSRSTPFQDFINQVPLDSEGHIKFPGSPEVWMVARGQSGSENQTASLLKKVSRIASPDVEDSILLRLARTEYSVGSEEISELANFMAVVRVEAHRGKPLDEPSALLLAQEHARHREIWPFLTGLTGLGFAEYTQLFRLGSKLRDLDKIVLNEVLGEFNSMTKILCLLQEFGRLDELQAASLIGSFCERLNRAVTTRDFAAASLNTVREMIKAAGIKDDDPDNALRGLLIKISDPFSLDLSGNTISVSGSADRHNSYQRVLELQKVPSLKALFTLQTAAENLAAGKESPPDEIKKLGEILAAIPEVEISKSAGLVKSAKESYIGLMLDKPKKTALDLQKAASKKKVNQKKLASLAQELLGELNPQVRLALTGIVYAYYFNPKDLLISEDPSFLRRHQFYQLDGIINARSLFQFAQLKSDEVAGSYLVGGFGNFGWISGTVSMATYRQSDAAAKPYAAAVLGSIRDADWQAVKDDELRLVGLRVRAAREWVLRSASDPVALNSLAESMEGLVSAGRRADLLRAVRHLEWDSAWKALSKGDLFFLGQQYMLRFSDHEKGSPTIGALRRFTARSDPLRLQQLGPELSSIYDCSHPHFVQLPPFENYNNIFPDRMAERSNEFKLYLAELLDREGFPAAVMGAVAEPLAIQLFAKFRMTGLKDWRSVISAYSSMNKQMIESALGEK